MFSQGPFGPLWPFSTLKVWTSIFIILTYWIRYAYFSRCHRRVASFPAKTPGAVLVNFLSAILQVTVSILVASCSSNNHLLSLRFAVCLVEIERSLCLLDFFFNDHCYHFFFYSPIKLCATNHISKKWTKAAIPVPIWDHVTHHTAFYERGV